MDNIVFKNICLVNIGLGLQNNEEISKSGGFFTDSKEAQLLEVIGFVLQKNRFGFFCRYSLIF